jgi:uncharacterized membrane protein YgaE (UPF0421/DUF939 family)
MADAGWSVVQTPVAAGLAWYIAHTLLGHHQPFFAPTAAAVSLSKATVLRGQRALQLIVGVTLGIGVGTAVKEVAGPTPGASGAVAIGVAAAIAMLGVLVLGGGFFEQGVLFVNQAATSAILMIAVTGAATDSERLTDALIGGGVTLVISVVLFPVAPVRLIQKAARQVLAALRDTLDQLTELARTDRKPDPQWALAAGQRIQRQLTGLQEARSTARQVANFSPRRWPERSGVRLASERTALIHLLAATVLNLAHVGTASPANQQPLPPSAHQALRALTSTFAALAEGDDGRAGGYAAQARALAVDAARTGGPHSQFVTGLIATCADDVLHLLGNH